MLLGLGGHAISTGDLADFDTMIGRTVIGDKFIQGSADAGSHIGVIAGSFSEKRVPYKLHDLIQRDRRFRRIDNSFEFGFKAHILATPIEVSVVPTGLRSTFSHPGFTPG